MLDYHRGLDDTSYLSNISSWLEQQPPKEWISFQSEESPKYHRGRTSIRTNAGFDSWECGETCDRIGYDRIEPSPESPSHAEAKSCMG